MGLLELHLSIFLLLQLQSLLPLHHLERMVYVLYILEIPFIF